MLDDQRLGTGAPQRPVTSRRKSPYRFAMQDRQGARIQESEVAPATAGLRLPRTFESWYAQHRSRVYRYVRFRVATREAAEDVTSEVFLKALRAFDRYDPSRSSPRTWLLRIARNAVTDHLRLLKRRGALHVSLDRIPDLVADVPSHEERLLEQERIQRLLNGSRQLRRGDQEILSLRYGAGLKNAEIAGHLKISGNAVAVRLHRALKRLKAAVDDAVNED